MASVTRKWIKENIESIYGFGGQVNKEDVLKMKVPKGGFETTLSCRAIRGEIDIMRKFNILLPHGIGWAECFPYNYTSENEWINTR